MPNEATSEGLSVYWQKQVNSWRESGQSQQAFCKTQDLSYTRFIYWRRKFEGKSKRARNQTSSGLVPVTCRMPVPATGLTLVLPGGLELRGLSEDNLSLAVHLLERLS
ncbi:MAG: hypothetical protein EP304_07365 [Deltaproteobacteria bacterium]|nr:MAG: hypothetical protein EP304_07365 [Deltaproteobacteria bacterium]